MRLLAYNILEGLRPINPSPNERRALDRARTRAALEVVEDVAPDLVVLNEALFCQQFAGRYVDYASLFGFPYTAVGLYDEAWGNAILSRWPILESRQVRTENRGGLLARIDTPFGETTVASYHPHPARDPDLRAADFIRLIQGVEGPLLLCGDFNCVHPDDELDIDAVVQAFAVFSTEPQEAVYRFVEGGRRVFAALEQCGLVDAVPPAGRRYTIPTDLLRADKRAAMRIDHIMCNERVEVQGGEVVHSAATNRASDHHPVWVDVSLR